MSPTTTSKFTFDTEFRVDHDVISPAARGRQKKTMTTDEIEAMVARAQQEGTEAGQVRASENINQTIAALVISVEQRPDVARAQLLAPTHRGADR